MKSEKAMDVILTVQILRKRKKKMKRMKLTTLSSRCAFDRNGTIIHQKTRSVRMTAPAQVCL